MAKDAKKVAAPVVAEFRKTFAQLETKALLHLSVDACRRASADGSDMPSEDALVAALCNPHRDPEDARQRAEAASKWEAAGLDIDDPESARPLMRATWRSVVTALEKATTKLAEAALAMKLTEADVTCADEFVLLLRRSPHAMPAASDIYPLARRVETLAVKMLRREPQVQTPEERRRDLRSEVVHKPIIDYVRKNGPSRRAKILRGVEATLPDCVRNIDRALSERVAAGILVKPKQGHYAPGPFFSER